MDTHKLRADDPNAARLVTVAQALAGQANSTQYVDYRQAERDCASLADKLVTLYSRHELKSFSYVAIPRGGLIVLGLLSYMLDLEASSFQQRDDNKRPAVVVDDCTLTGLRFRQQLAQIQNEQVLFAHLYSHPDLRAAIVAHEERVVHCAAARDLSDLGPDQFSDQAHYLTWQSKWHERYNSQRYWVGSPQPIAFAWSEPDRPFWNPVTEQIEKGWHFLSPHLCLKNLTQLDLPPKDVHPREWHQPSAVICGIFDNRIWVVNTESELVFSFTDVSADMWRALTGYGRVDAAVDYLSDRYEIETDLLKHDLIAFAESLAAHGLLHRTAPPQSPPAHIGGGQDDATR